MLIRKEIMSLVMEFRARFSREEQEKQLENGAVGSWMFRYQPRFDVPYLSLDSPSMAVPVVINT